MLDGSNNMERSMGLQNAPKLKGECLSKGCFPILDLPNELIGCIIKCVDDLTLKSLRLTCIRIYSLAHLRISRVFLSVNDIDISVFRQIASHDYYRKRVEEIIYDDFYFYEPKEFEGLGWIRRLAFEEAYKCTREDFLDRLDLATQIRRPEILPAMAMRDELMSVEDSWRCNQEIIERQQASIGQQQDLEALIYGLKRFPNLKRITITPVAHGFLSFPLYRTPFIRSLPFGFVYPRSQHGWQAHIAEYRFSADVLPWDTDGYPLGGRRGIYRGFCVVMTAMQEHISSLNDPYQNRLVELSMDAKLVKTGMTPLIFERDNVEYQRFVNVLQQPGFRRLDLTFTTARGRERHDYRYYRNGLMRDALSVVPGMEHFTFTASNPLSYEERLDYGMEDWVPLSLMFPIGRWPRLKHFGIVGWRVYGPDLLDLLARLPRTVKTIELGALDFIDNSGNNAALLEAIRDRLDWRRRPSHEQPRLSMVQWVRDDTRDAMEGIGVWLDEEVNQFIYNNGPNPFQMNLRLSNRGEVRNLFDPGYVRPSYEYHQHQNRWWI